MCLKDSLHELSMYTKYAHSKMLAYQVNLDSVD